MHLLRQLEKIGYQATLDGDNVRLTWRGMGKPDPAIVRPLLEELKRRKEEAIRWLVSQQQEPDYEAEAAKAAKLLRELGWCAIECRTLGGEVVIWVRSEKVAIPARWRDAVRYTLAELEALRKPPKPSPEDLRKLHGAKRLFGGEIGAGEPDGS